MYLPNHKTTVAGKRHSMFVTIYIENAHLVGLRQDLQQSPEPLRPEVLVRSLLQDAHDTLVRAEKGQWQNEWEIPLIGTDWFSYINDPFRRNTMAIWGVILN
ncbi:hypothetical protein AVEN_183026-1 [Araneus ventricosus]|uniref:Uncharacterized protein n=1 Tax=Araneus ventricosus TaxID=182803 RepID=A0A4Y2HZJ3_ARAVE|nr:hypothetical protein AVEN_1533-1 [Araneus ventricosus]GBM70763.1 hypothetical protein AVEN_183026-1 [Araneus ventricosus]